MPFVLVVLVIGIGLVCLVVGGICMVICRVARGGCVACRPDPIWPGRCIDCGYPLGVRRRRIHNG
ncbi:MAG: hypothetical protein V4636_13085 [Pseudomonadota bacterium]